MEPRVSDRVAAGAIVLLAFAAYGPGLVPGRVRAPADLLEKYAPWVPPGGKAVSRTDPVLGDLISVFHPWLNHTVREVREGRLPLWNPYTYCGSPHVGAAQTAVFSPFTALAYFLPLGFAIGLACVLASMLGGLSMHWFLRLLGLPPAAALAGAIGFMFCGFVSAWMGWSLAFTAVWCPAVFAGIELARREATWASAVPLALATAGMSLAGHPETAFHVGVAAAVYAAVAARGGGGRFILLAGAGFGAGLLIAACQILPMLEYIPHTQTFLCRSEGGIRYGVPPRVLLLLLVPRYYGQPEAAVAWERVISANLNEVSCTVGLLPVLLLPAAVAAWRRPRVSFFLGLATFCVFAVYWFPILTVGDKSFSDLLLKVPGFTLCVNYRIVLLLSFSLSVLGAFGMERIMVEGVSPRMGGAVGWWAALLVLVLAVNLLSDRLHMEWGGAWKWVLPRALLAAALLGTGAMAVRRSRGGRPGAGVAAVLLAVQAASTLPFAAGYCPVVKGDRLYRETPGISFLKARAGGSRVYMPLLNTAQVFGLRDAGGYDAMNPVDTTDLIGFSGTLRTACNLPTPSSNSWGFPVFRFLGVRYALMPPGANPPADDFRVVQYDGPDARVFEYPRALPRALLVPRAVVFPTREAELEALWKGRVDPSREVSMAGEDADPAPLAGKPVRGSARIARDESSLVEVRTESDREAYLVLADSFYPGWRAYLDGARVRIFRANHAFRAVRVPAGEHEVVFRYAPASFRLGAALSLAGLLALALMWFSPRRGTARGR